MAEVDINNRKLNEKLIEETDVSVYAYDKSIVEDLRARFKVSNGGNKPAINDTVQIGAPQNMFNILGTLNGDQVVMPFIGLQRIDWQLNLDRQGHQTFIGDLIDVREGDDGLPVEVRAQVIPITINYMLSVYSTDRITNDALCRELLFYYHLRPTLMCYIGHGLNLAHKFNIRFNSGIEDNSDIANHNINGTYYRQDITFYVDDAYLWRANIDEKVAVCPNIFFDYKIDESIKSDYAEVDTTIED